MITRYNERVVSFIDHIVTSPKTPADLTEIGSPVKISLQQHLRNADVSFFNKPLNIPVHTRPYLKFSADLSD